MSLPWSAGELLPVAAWRSVRRQAIFRYHKWDQQVGDVATFCPLPLIVERAAWDELTAWSEWLAAETLAAEKELLARPGLHDALGLPPALQRHLREAGQPSIGKARLIRFDFHFTTEGWRISEANTDVPGGWNEASGYPELLAPHFPHLQPVDSMVEAYAARLTEGLRLGALAGLVHATAYTDDRQAMVFLAEKLEARGCRACLLSPEQIAWRDGVAYVRTKWCDEPADLLVRYYPGEWLPNLPAESAWRHFLTGSLTPISNPATALLTQSKRWPLVWDQLDTPLPTWRKLLPACAETGETAWELAEDWIAKPALGRVGHAIGLRDCLTEKEWADLRKNVRRNPRHWVAQRRFQLVPLPTPAGESYPCLGIYTIDGKSAGAYGRIATRPLIDHQAQDVAVFISPRP
jgi:glutathionylspermidine synthase